MMPLTLFASRTFSAVNLVTFVVYVALAGVFFFVVINLQVVASHRSPPGSPSCRSPSRCSCYPPGPGP
jgi:nitrate reductase NapE component